nr:hypothetical protein [uncultured Bacillus sp.]
MLKRGFLCLALLLSFSMLVGFDTPNVSAATASSESKMVSPKFVNDFRYRKVNVSTKYEWSGYRRVSDNLSTYGSTGGSISANRTTTFTTQVSGTISGLGISTSKTISNSIGYTLSVGANRKVYLGYRVYYKVEKGTRQYYDVTTGKVISSNSYTVKTPQYGQYALINY